MSEDQSKCFVKDVISQLICMIGCCFVHCLKGLHFAVIMIPLQFPKEINSSTYAHLKTCECNHWHDFLTLRTFYCAFQAMCIYNTGHSFFNISALNYVILRKQSEK